LRALLFNLFLLFFRLLFYLVVFVMLGRLFLVILVFVNVLSLYVLIVAFRFNILFLVS
jgi:hypothetical protein